MVSGLRLGLTLRDIDKMDVGEVLDLVITMVNTLGDVDGFNNSVANTTHVRDATQEDIRKFFG